MPYHIAGIDVHKKILAVAVADVTVDGDFHFERLKMWDHSRPVARACWLAVEREVEGSRDGIDRAILATGQGGVGAVLETDAPDAR